jgi:glycerol-3-phosphate O-acyltransferase/dihydroxyacetone phosphate acyltransferase
MVDPALLAHTILQAGDIPVSNLIPNFWAKKTFIGLIAKYLGSITLDRASDFQIPGTGRIILPDPVNQPLVIRGIGTKFVEEAQIGGLVLLPTLDQRTSFATIESIPGPEEIHLKRPFSQPQNALLQLSANSGENGNGSRQIYGSSFKLAPKLDRAKLFESLSREFGNNRRLLIFPEGASHDRPTLIPIQGSPILFVQNIDQLTILRWSCEYGVR